MFVARVKIPRIDRVISSSSAKPTAKLLPRSAYIQREISSRVFRPRCYNTAAMATASKIQLSPSHRPVFAVPNLQQASADKASELLQKNHDWYHIYFNEDGFHNHVVHHLLSIYALGATPSELEKGWQENASYQMAAKPENERIIQDMHNPATFKKYLGQRNHFPDYLRFFKQQIEQKGWQEVLNDWLFSGTELADDLFVRLFAGFLHPVIHLGFGIEFAQPAIIAEALAQTCTHDTWIGKLLVPAEEYAKTHSGEGSQPSKTLLELLREGTANKKLVNSIRDEDGNKIRDGVIPRAGDEMMALAGQWVVKPDEISTKCAEMLDFCSYDTMAAQRPAKEIRMDFFLMHDANCAVFFPYLMSHPSMSWLSDANKARLLEWKGRTDLAQYIARGSPELLPAEIEGYVPKAARANGANGHANGDADGDARATAETKEWDGIFRRTCVVSDDGHCAKLVRVLAAGEQVCGETAVKDAAVKKDMWVKMGHMTIDSIEDVATMSTPQKWVRSTGLDSAWANVPDRKTPRGSTL